MFLCDVSVATRSWWNSWWKCRRPYPTLRYFSGLWSSTSTFQFLLVEGETLVFKVFSQNRVQLFRFLQNAFLSGLWSRSLTFLLPVEAFTIFVQDRVHPQLRTLQLLGSALRMSHFGGGRRGSHSFPGRKSATDTRHMGARVPRHVSSSTSFAYGLRSWVDDDTGETWTLLTDPALGSWWYSLRTHRSQWHPPWERGAGCCWCWWTSL